MLRPRGVVGVQPLLSEVVRSCGSISGVVVGGFRRFLCRFLRGGGGWLRDRCFLDRCFLDRFLLVRFLLGSILLGSLSGGLSGRRPGVGRGSLRPLSAALAVATLTVQFALLSDKSCRAFGYLVHIHAMRVRPFEEIVHACGSVESAGSGLDPKGEGDGDDCSEGFEVHFQVGYVVGRCGTCTRREQGNARERM